MEQTIHVKDHDVIKRYILVVKIVLYLCIPTLAASGGWMGNAIYNHESRLSRVEVVIEKFDEVNRLMQEQLTVLKENKKLLEEQIRILKEKK